MGKKLMIVERDEDILQIISIIFEQKGYKVSAYNREDGILDKIHDEQPDAILLDIIRPTIEGTQLCRAIKETETTKHIPVIVLSTHLQITQVKEVCADEVMAKPFDIDELISTVEKQLELLED
jgi:DNA-binding response OmpR family regulator